MLQAMYRDKCELVVVFLCKEYSEKEWGGLKWQAVKLLLKNDQMFSHVSVMTTQPISQ